MIKQVTQAEADELAAQERDRIYYSKEASQARRAASLPPVATDPVVEVSLEPVTQARPSLAPALSYIGENGEMAPWMPDTTKLVRTIFFADGWTWDALKGWQDQGDRIDENKLALDAEAKATEA